MKLEQNLDLLRSYLETTERDLLVIQAKLTSPDSLRDIEKLAEEGAILEGKAGQLRLAIKRQSAQFCIKE